ncbi:MAG: FG-GAP-like repeat-containing protein [Saprospiraceae bacterium]
MKALIFNVLYLFPAAAFAQLFTDATANLPAAASGANMDVRAFDLEGDGDLDLVFAREFQPNFLLRNNGQAVFTNATPGNLPQETHDSEDVAVADFNGDGHLDLVFCSEDDVAQGWSNVHEFYLGDGAGKFAAAAYQPPDSEANAVIAADLNSDGLPDLLFGNKGTIGVLINNGAGGFSAENQRVPQIQRTTQDLALADVDGDGDADLFAGNENGNLLLINDGTGNFTDETAARLPAGLNIETRKVAFGDVEGDGDLDIFLSNVAFLPGKNPQNRLFINDGAGHFTDKTATQLPTDAAHTIDAIFEDIDLDGDLDLVVANVFGGPLKIYGNDGSGHFSDATLAVLGKNFYRDALGVIAADFNGDGLRDLYVCHRNTPQNPQKDLLLLRSPVVAAPEADDLANEVRIFPNPIDNQFFIKTNRAHLDTVRLQNSTGQTLFSMTPKPAGEGVFRCDLPKGRLPSGIYFLSVGDARKPIFIR